MKILKQYICEICGTIYANEQMAERCEATHIRPKSVDDMWFYYKPITMNNTGVPYKIVLKDNNGKEHAYKE